MSQANLTDAIPGIPGLIESAVTALIIPEGHNGIVTTNNRIEVMLQGLVNKAIDKKVRSIELENYLACKVENLTSWPRYGTKTTEKMLDNQDFIAPLAAVVKKETKKGVDVEAKREDRRWKAIEVVYSTSWRSA